MASSLYFPGKYFFYPIGNTSAVCLTRDVPPDLPVSVLLLPCGDPRNVLYTVFCEESNRLGRSLDFTCCDFDPGVLARNVLLLTMVMDGVASPTMWNIFFHMYLDADSRSTLMSHSQKLASYSSVGAWRSSPYGATIRMGTEHTFAELRRHWELYAHFYHPSKLHRLQTLQATMKTKLTKASQDSTGFNITSSRSAGPLFVRFQTNHLIGKQFDRYWETGTTFTEKRKLAAATYPNSTFFYSRAHEGFDVHYGTDPMIPFHHAPLLGNTKRALAVGDLVESARSQFHDWCSAFGNAASPRAGKSCSAIVVRFLLGEALAVARALRDFPEQVGILAHPFATPKVAPWTTRVMELDREEYADFGAPTRFNVIDTSNLSDHIGMLNMLLATVPLLTYSPSSALYTESLLTHTSDPRTELESKLFADLSVVATLMDLAPVDALSGFTTRCNTHELIAISTLVNESTRQHHQTITWRRPSSGDPSAYAYCGSHPPLSFDPRQLAKLLHTIYTSLYRTEDPMSLLTMGRSDLMGTLGRSSSTCPPREAIVVLLDFIHTGLHIPTEQWSDVVRFFLDMRSEDAATSRIFDRLGDAEIHAQLYRYGLYTVPGLDQVRKPTTGRLSHWTTIPPLVRVFLSVPRTHLAKLEGVSDTVPTPWLRCAIGTPRGEHIFQSVEAAFGKLVDTGTAAEPDLAFHEEPEGQRKGSDFVFSFVVPSRILVEGPASAISVGLAVRADPMVARVLTPVLGLALCVFQASLSDTDYVHLLPERPLRSSGQPAPGTVPPRKSQSEGVDTIGYQQPVHVDLDSAGKHVASLTAKLEITNAATQAAFAGGAMPNILQCSPCAIQVLLDGQTQTLVYPMPIVGSRRKVRLARKSSYIEVAVPVAIPFLEPDGLKLNPFPVVRTNTSLSPWNIHRVFLDRLPVMNLTKANVSQLQEWYNPHVGSQLSIRERASIRDPARLDLLANIKETIHCIMMRFAGTQGRKEASQAFALRDGATEDCDTLIFVDKLRFDLSAHGMVCDAFVLPLSHAIMPRITPAFEQLLRRDGGLENVKLYGQEMRGWKLLLPALVERCRATWAHGANCEYAAQGRIPLELEISEGDPLCSCGRGKDTDGMMKDGVWKKFAPYVTRIALSPLFAVSYLEPVLDLEGQIQEKARSSVPASSPLGSNASGASSAARCNKCGKEESDALKLSRCSRCRMTFYCSEACQKSDWKSHKLQCRN